MEKILVEGIKIDSSGTIQSIKKFVGTKQFVPHQLLYYKEVIKRIKENL